MKTIAELEAEIVKLKASLKDALNFTSSKNDVAWWRVKAISLLDEAEQDRQYDALSLAKNNSGY